MSFVNYQYHVKICVLCHFETCVIRFKPFSASERLLIIDEGGTREIIPLEILTIIQDMMRNEFQIQDLFDIVFDISVGKFRVLVLLSGAGIEQVIWV